MIIPSLTKESIVIGTIVPFSNFIVKLPFCKLFTLLIFSTKLTVLVVEFNSKVLKIVTMAVSILSSFKPLKSKVPPVIPSSILSIIFCNSSSVISQNKSAATVFKVPRIAALLLV